jgi:inosose dehydratase
VTAGPALTDGAASTGETGTAAVAGAPISWGVCEVPGWGHQLPAAQVLAEMHDLGLAATELGPDGYLPSDPATRNALLAGHGLAVAGGFVPIVLHERAVDTAAAVDAALAAFEGAGTGHGGKPVLVLAAATGRDGYEGRPELDADGWSTLLASLGRAAARAAERGYLATLHPHVGTMVETTDDVNRVLDRSEIPLCLDTGHLLIGGTDPAVLAAQAARRIGHVHLKDVSASVARRVASGELSYTDAVRAGLYRPLGQGDVDLAAVVAALRQAGYAGWYVLEQDTILVAAPAGEGPAAQVRESLQYLRSLL